MTPIENTINEIENSIQKNNKLNFWMNQKILRSPIRQYCKEKGYYDHTDVRR
jgi:hypothetical protein